MVLVEAGTYSFTGFLTGCILGIILQKLLVTNLLSQMHIVCKFPLVQTIYDSLAKFEYFILPAVNSTKIINMIINIFGKTTDFSILSIAQ